MEDRRVHASSREFEVVRYERAGKWYIEPLHPEQGKRQNVNVDQAVNFAYHLQRHDGVVHFGIPGGSLFDKRLREYP